MKSTKRFEIKFSRDRKIILSLEYPRWMGFLLKFMGLRIYIPIPMPKEHFFDLNKKLDGTYEEPLVMEEFLK